MHEPPVEPFAREAVVLFRRTKEAASQQASTVDEKVDGKGRPTPSRKEAEAARRDRARAAAGGTARAGDRLSRAESSRKMREAMKSGDERYLPERDKGPVKRFLRDFVDVRLSLMEILIPLMLVTLVLGVSGNPSLIALGNSMLYAGVLLVVLDTVLLRFRVKRAMAERFPGEPTKGAYRYALMRSLQMKFMRMPKAQVKLGQTLPKVYR